MSTDSVPPPPANSSPPRRKHGCFYYGCMLSVLAMLLGIGSCAVIVTYGGSEMAPVCERFITDVEENKLPEAYAALGEKAKQSQSEDDFVAYMTQVKKALGPLVRKERTATGVFSRNGTTAGQIAYDAGYQKDQATLSFGLEKIEGKWIIQSINIDSKAIRDTLICKACGAKQKSFSRYC